MTDPKPARLQGLDVARFLAFVGMVIVNFRIVMGASADINWPARIASALEGRAAASFVMLAGIGLGLAAQRADYGATLGVTLKRALFLLVAGLLNMLIFDADILHYYAFYFLFGALLLPLGSRTLVAITIGLNLLFMVLLVTLDYEAGWDWSTFTYPEFWTPVGFVRNLFFNGWHPVIPWLGFLLLGIVLSRLGLSKWSTQLRLILVGLLCLLIAEGTAGWLQTALAAEEPELAEILTTSAIPPTPFYFLAGAGFASALIGFCLWLSDRAWAQGMVRAVTPAGRQALTLYLAHILIGMVTLDILGLLGGQSAGTALLAALIFSSLAILYALAWSKRYRRGPVEALMRRVAG